MEDKERSGRPKVYKDTELEALLDQDPCQTQGRRIRWTILGIKHKVPFFYNICPIFDQKRRKLICTPDMKPHLKDKILKDWSICPNTQIDEHKYQRNVNLTKVIQKLFLLEGLMQLIK